SEEKRRKLTPEHRLKTTEEMTALFADIPEAVQNTGHIAKRCSYIAHSHAPILPRFAQEGKSEEELLREQSVEGLEERLSRYVFSDVMSAAEKDEKGREYADRLVFDL